MSRILVSLLLLLGCQTLQAEELNVDAMQMKEVLKRYSEKEQAQFQDIANRSLDAYHQAQKNGLFQQETQAMKRRADAIADESMAKDRADVLNYLGINPQANQGLYYFVSWSMGVDMLRAYAMEAMWTGGILVFRGVPEGKDIAKFITEDLYQLIQGKGAAAHISIDPRLYDVYDITAVPSIVYTEEVQNLPCEGNLVSKISHNGVNMDMRRCRPMPESKFWKLTGAVSTQWALREIMEKGGVGAKVYLDNLVKSLGGKPDKEQKPFKGNWEEALSPSDKMAIKDAVNTLQSQPKESEVKQRYEKGEWFSKP